MLVGNVDALRRDQIAGWAADTDFPDGTVAIVVAVNGRDIGEITADRPRMDLRALGIYGEGHHGFVFQFSEALPADQEHSVVVRFAQTTQMLGHGQARLPREAHSTDQQTAASDRRAGRNLARRSDTRSYVIHIGMPKTGTKYLQACFSRQKNEMLAAGIYYPTEHWQTLEIFGHHELVEQLRRVPNEHLEHAFEQLNASGHKTILLSCEGFIGVPEAQLQYLKHIIGDADVRIVFYARRWSDWIPSQWQQTIKQGKVDTFAEMYARTLATAFGDQGINYNIILDKFSSIFGTDSIHIVPYSTLLDHGKDIFNHFAHEILEWDSSNPHGEDRVHESMGMFLTELVRCLNALECDRQGTSGYHIFQAYTSLQNRADTHDCVEHLFHVMKGYVAETVVDDNSYPFRSIYDQINERYRHRLVTIGPRATVFERRRQTFQFVRPEFLLAEDSVETIHRIYDAITRRLPATSVSSA